MGFIDHKFKITGELAESLSDSVLGYPDIGSSQNILNAYILCNRKKDRRVEIQTLIVHCVLTWAHQGGRIWNVTQNVSSI